LFSASVDDKGQLTNIQPFPDMINTKYHESNATFTPDGSIMYFDRSGDKQVKVGNEEVATIKIFKAEFKDGKWIYATKLPLSSDEYSVEHPCLTKDGKQMFFASDMPGGMVPWIYMWWILMRKAYSVCPEILVQLLTQRIVNNSLL